MFINSRNMISRIISTAIVVVTSIIALMCALSGPDQIILHWNLSGDVDSYGPKYLILTLPFISFVIFLMMIAKEKTPSDRGSLRALMRTEQYNSKHAKVIRVITPLLLLAILYVTACSAGLFRMCTMIPFAIVILVAIIRIYMSHKSGHTEDGSMVR